LRILAAARTVIPGNGRRDRDDDAGSRAHIERHFRGKSVGKRKNEFLDPRQQVLTQPLDDIAIRRQQLQFTIPLDRLQGRTQVLNLLFRELALEHSQTAVP